MTLADRLAAVLPEATVGSAYGVVTADVAREHWVASAAAVRSDPELDGTFFDVLLAVDEHPRGFDVVVRLWSVGRRHGFHLRTHCPRENPRLPSLVGVFAGASWHEREAAEMFGLTFEGHPGLLPLLLPDGFVGHPLRKERVLAARQQPWPGAVDPADARGRPPQPPTPAAARLACSGAAGRAPVTGAASGDLTDALALVRAAQQEPPARSRGTIALVEENCTVCMLCARECPDWCLYVEGHTEPAPPARPGGRPRVRHVLDRFAIDWSLCMYCGICVEVCPFDALFWAPALVPAGDRRPVEERADLRAWVRAVPPPPALDAAAEPAEEVVAAQRLDAVADARRPG